ncbi:hypothetical protein GCM10019016_010330 [Streptomyces prasinosporus]|uniref:DUF6545 domain-containing protein n=1 Tax=Streptomyces prasinosporus TaxID=68256 RepID=A0ABP6TFF4_9ACTN|nr:hypothetical protein GCM10010332_71910 [Streptomyces albogriseolus]
MSSDLPGDWALTLDLSSVSLLWAALLLRALPAIRQPHHRALWLAVASAALAMTLNIEPVREWIAAVTGSHRAVAIVRNQIGVVSAGAVLLFTVRATGERCRTGALLAAIATVMAMLLALAGLGAVPANSQGPFFGRASTPCAAYWLLLIAVHITACAACVWVCWIYGRRGPHASVNLSLILFGSGTAFAGLFWLAHLVLLAIGSRPGTALRALMSLHAVLRAAALLVPTVVEVRHAVGHAGTIWRIWPLWRGLVDAVPHVALSTTRSRLLVLLHPHLPLRLIVYRTVIEIRDAILALSHYADPAVFRSARAHVARRGVPADHTDAYVTACVLRQARAAKLAGSSPNPGAAVITTNQDTGDLAAETTFLLRLADAYLSPCVRDFGKSAAATPTPAGGSQ